MILLLVIRLFLVGRLTASIIWTRKASGRRRGGIGLATVPLPTSYRSSALITWERIVQYKMILKRRSVSNTR